MINLTAAGDPTGGEITGILPPMNKLEVRAEEDAALRLNSFQNGVTAPRRIAPLPFSIICKL